MQLKQLLNDDDAVSPVIGVILMVAITVILAAVIASFVLGLGNSATNTNPQASFSFDYEEVDDRAAGNPGMVTISHDGGDTINDQELYVRGSGFWAPRETASNPADWRTWLKENTSSSSIDHNATGLWNGTKSGDDSAIVSGDRANVIANSTYEIDVVYQSQEGQASSTLQEDGGPDA